MSKLSWLLKPSKFCNGLGIIAPLAAAPERWTAESPEKPLSLATGPRSGRTSSTAPENNVHFIAEGGRFRSGGDTSNATALENFGDKPWEACATAVEGNKIVKLMSITNVATKANSLLIRIVFSPELCRLAFNQPSLLVFPR